MSPTERQVSHALLTRSPLSKTPKDLTPFDLHVLGTPPAFVLSQDQTLKKLYLNAFALKSFSESFALANILKNFRWLKFVYTKLKQFIIVQGVLSSSSRYSIYKVQTSFSQALARSELLYVSTTFSICQELFSKFLNNFLSCGCSPGAPFIKQP